MGLLGLSGNGSLGPQLGGSNIFNGAVPGTANYGLINFGAGPWDGSSAGFFTGSASGTLIAGNVPTAFAGNLIDLQRNGTSKFSIDRYGDLNVIANIFMQQTPPDAASGYGLLSIGPNNNFAGNANGTFLAIRAATSDTANAIDYQVNGVSKVSVNHDGMLVAGAITASHFGGVCTAVKAGTPADADFATPTNGAIIGDSTGSKIWIRLAGTWKSVAVA